MKYEAAIFDLDGTLLNTLEDLADAVNVALKENGMPPRTVEEVRQFVGNGIVKLIERAVPQGRENPAFDSTLQDFKKYYGQHCNDKTKPYPGILETLNRLKERGVSMAIVSNKADFAVKELNPLYFEGVIVVALGENEEVGGRKKPAPDTVIVGPDLRKMIRVQHDRVSRHIGERCLEFLFRKDLVCGTQLLHNGRVQTHALFHLGSDDETLPLQFRHLRLHVSLAIDGQCIR